MSESVILSRSLLRRAENSELALGSLSAITEIRESLDRFEKAAIESAREKGATIDDIAGALNLTPQAIYYRFRAKRGEGGSGAASAAAVNQALSASDGHEAEVAFAAPSAPIAGDEQGSALGPAGTQLEVAPRITP